MMETDAFFSVSSTAGTLYVYKDSLEISEATFTLCDMIADDEINDRYSMSFISALSALEYDAIDESTMKWESKISGTPRNAFEKAVEIYNSDIYDAVNDYGFADAKNNSDGVLVYSGNYDYFLQYRPFDNGGREYEQYWIGAREHE